MTQTILIVDDEPDIVYMVQVILRSEGFAVESAGTVREANEFISGEQPAMVLLDVRLPDGEGWEVLAELRQRGILDRVPVIMLSAHASPDSIKRAVSEGARTYVTKPFHAERLLEAVRSNIA